MSDDHPWKSLPLLNGLTPVDLWPTNTAALLGWACLVFLPYWKHTPKISLLPPLLHSAIYALAIVSLMLLDESGVSSNPDFSKLEAVVAMFRDPNVVFVGWFHYLAFDLLIGRMILLDSLERGASWKFHTVVMAPCLCLTLFLGPAGWLLYTILQTVILPDKTTKTKVE